MRLRHYFRTAAAASVQGLCSPAMASSLIADKGTILEVPANAVIELANDEANISFYATETGESLSQTTKTVVERVNAGLAKLKALDLPVKYETLNLSSWPQYSPAKKDEVSKIVGWQVKQGIRVTVTDVAQTAQVAQVVGERFAFDSVQFGVSRASSDAAQNELMRMAIEAVKVKAFVAAQALGASQKDVKIEKIDISGAAVPRPMMMRAYASDGMNRMEKSSLPMPSFDAGSSSLSISVNAKVRVGD